MSMARATSDNNDSGAPFSGIEVVRGVEVHIERLKNIAPDDLTDLCEATDQAILDGGGFGWLEPPERWRMENFWNGVALMPERFLWVGRLDGIIGGAVQLHRSPKNNEAQRYVGRISGLFVAPWARGFGLSRRLISSAEAGGRKLGMEVINLDLRVTQGAAIAVMEKLGYTQIGEHPNYAKVNGKWIKGLYYTKRLTR